MRSLSSSITLHYLQRGNIDLVDLITRRLVKIESLIRHIEKPAIRSWIELNGSLCSIWKSENIESLCCEIISSDALRIIERSEDIFSIWCHSNLYYLIRSRNEFEIIGFSIHDTDRFLSDEGNEEIFPIWSKTNSMRK